MIRELHADAERIAEDRVLSEALIKNLVRYTREDGVAYLEYISATKEYGCKCSIMKRCKKLKIAKPDFYEPIGKLMRKGTSTKCSCKALPDERVPSFNAWWINSLDIVPLEQQLSGEKFILWNTIAPYDEFTTKKNDMTSMLVKLLPRNKQTINLVESKEMDCVRKSQELLKSVF